MDTIAVETSGTVTATEKTQQQHQFCLENVLNDYETLSLFKSWMGVDDDSSEHPLRLHFAIVAFKEMIQRKDDRHLLLAREIYNKFLKPQTGLCDFIDESIRRQIGVNLRAALKDRQPQQQKPSSPSVPPPLSADFFDDCLPSLNAFLQGQLAIFIGSDEFLDFFNRQQKQQTTMDSTDSVGPRPSTAENLPQQQQQKPSSSHPYHPVNKRPTDRKSVPNNFSTDSGEAQTLTPLTADALLKSQYDREVLVGEKNSMLQKLFKPVSKFPYVGNAQTSKNDSAVSSSFSNDTHGSRHKTGGSNKTGTLDVRVIREEHMRCNNQPMKKGLPKFEPLAPFQQQDCQGQVQSTNIFRHDTPQGRQVFAETLSEKLQLVQESRSGGEEVDVNTPEEDNRKRLERERKLEILRRFDVFGREGCKSPTEAELAVEVDDEIERILAEKEKRMLLDSASRRSPMVTLSRKTRRGNRSSSPFDSAKNTMFDQFGTLAMPSGYMAQSEYHQQPQFQQMNPAAMAQSSYMPASTATAAYGQQQQQQHFGGGGGGGITDTPQRRHHRRQSKSPSHAAFFYGGEKAAMLPPSATASYYHHNQQQQPQFNHHHPSMQQQQTTAMLGVYPSTTAVEPPVQVLTNICGPPLPPRRSIPGHHHNSNVPPAHYHHHPQQEQSKKNVVNTNASYCCSGGGGGAGDNDCDTSGFGSMTTTHISDASNNSAGLNSSSRRKAAFRKANELSCGGAGVSAGGHHQQFFQQMNQPAEGTANTGSNFGTIPRFKTGGSSDFQHLHLQNQCGPMLTLSYRDAKKGVPVLARVPQRAITLKEFRRCFSISSQDKRQFFFKAPCEDGSAPYQLMLVTEDSAVLPVFEGKITAECRHASSDSD